jgi:hypothetical protein
MSRSSVSALVLHALLCLSPVLALALPLLARRYPGERTLLALRRAQPIRPRHARASAPARGRRFAAPAARGGQLLARHLAVRPPPLLRATS